LLGLVVKLAFKLEVTCDDKCQTLVKCFFKALIYYSIYLFIFSGTRISTHGFMLARQKLYLFSHAASPFWSDYFGDRVSLFAQASLDVYPHILRFQS
jgi:hypothetical protein